jgi:hypothetical protein
MGLCLVSSRATELLCPGLCLMFRLGIADSTPGVLVTWEVYAKEHDLDLVEVLKSKSLDDLRAGCLRWRLTIAMDL